MAAQRWGTQNNKWSIKNLPKVLLGGGAGAKKVLFSFWDDALQGWGDFLSFYPQQSCPNLRRVISYGSVIILFSLIYSFSSAKTHVKSSSKSFPTPFIHGQYVQGVWIMYMKTMAHSKHNTCTNTRKTESFQGYVDKRALNVSSIQVMSFHFAAMNKATFTLQANVSQIWLFLSIWDPYLNFHDSLNVTNAYFFPNLTKVFSYGVLNWIHIQCFSRRLQSKQ